MEKWPEWFSGWLSDYTNYEIEKNSGGFSLDAMLALAEAAGNPQRAFKSLHVAGSKGKGSVSAMAASILHNAGLATGLYTSPHIISFLERVTGPAGLPPQEAIEASARAVVSCAEKAAARFLAAKRPSWFELVTLFAMLAFKEAGYQWAVFETGLGGRLDATNILVPEGCIITPIELEHTAYLGGTIREIAGEKAGIIKEGIPVFIARQEDEARGAFEKRAMELSAPAFFMDEAISSLEYEYAKPEGEGFKTLLSVKAEFNMIEGGARFARPLSFMLQMPSAVQAENAALAAYAIKALLPNIDEAAIETGLSSCLLPGRLEILSGGSFPIVLDGAHTEKSLKSALSSFFAIFGEKRCAHLLFACAADKNASAMAVLADKKFERVTLTRPGGKKQSDIAGTSQAFRKACRTASGGEARVILDWNAAIEAALEEAEKENAALLITGSFYLLAEAKKTLAPRREGQERRG